MDLKEFKLKNLGIEPKIYKNIYTFVDFGNVNYWFEYDEKDYDDNKLSEDTKLAVDVKKLADFIDLFSIHKRFYFGIDDQRTQSLTIIAKARKYFKTIAKPIQRIKHYLKKEEIKTNTREINKDSKGKYILIPKCNFDVEICIDAFRLLDKYDTFCLFSSDADFAYLVEFLHHQNKRVILFSSGYVSRWLKEKVDLNINCQKIKQVITFIKRKSRR